MEKYTNFYIDWLSTVGLSTDWANFIRATTIIVIILIFCYIADIVTKRLIINFIAQIVKHSKTKWDDIILDKKVFNRLAHFAPAIIIHYTIGIALLNAEKAVNFIQSAIYVYMTVVAMIVINAFLKALHEIYTHSEYSKNRPIKGYIQLVNIFIIIVGVILIYSHISGNSVKGILAGLGAMAAVLMLVFKDTILGLVASIQLSANKMVKIGDWISMPSHKADGTVEEITLNTVKVQNWDKTISTIPTYALVSESFSNWRGMEESGGRRIKRSINIDMRSVKFCSPELIHKFSKIQYLSKYINDKQNELNSYNSENNIDNSVLVNGRRITNLGTFRKYIEEYLKHNKKIHKEMTFLVRQLQPNANGIPIEIYVFSNDQAWANYESIQADIFDHILAVIPEFELQVFQNPSGNDVSSLLVNFNNALTIEK